MLPAPSVMYPVPLPWPNCSARMRPGFSISGAALGSGLAVGAGEGVASGAAADCSGTGEGCGVAVTAAAADGSSVGCGVSMGADQCSETAAAGSWQSTAPRSSQVRPGRRAAAASVSAVPPASTAVQTKTARQRRSKPIEATSIPSHFM